MTKFSKEIVDVCAENEVMGVFEDYIGTDTLWYTTLKVTGPLHWAEKHTDVEALIAVIGNGNFFNDMSSIKHDVTIGNFTHLAPHACVGGGVTLGATCLSWGWCDAWRPSIFRNWSSRPTIPQRCPGCYIAR